MAQETDQYTEKDIEDRSDTNKNMSALAFLILAGISFIALAISCLQM